MSKRKKTLHKHTQSVRKTNEMAAALALLKHVAPLNLRTGGYLGLENLFQNYQIAATAFSTSWGLLNPTTFDCISVAAQGQAENQYQGKQYHINSLHIKGEVTRQPLEGQTTPASSLKCRIAVVQDTNTNGAALTPGDVFDTSQTDDLFAFRNLQHTKRFKVLMDKTITLSPIAMNEGGVNSFAMSQVRRTFKFNRNFKVPLQINMKGTTAVVANVVDNSIHVIGIADDASVTIEYQARMRFSP